MCHRSRLGRLPALEDQWRSPAAASVRASAPLCPRAARLFVNDYGVLTGNALADYERQIQGVVDAGMPVGGIGVQGHYGGPVDAAKARRVFDRLARFGLPVAVTEFDANMANEEAKALALVTLYSTAFAHPAVDNITMWGFWEGAHWRPKAALWRKDWTKTPAALWYRELVFKRWWTDFSGRVDEHGECKVRVFCGQHEVSMGGSVRTVEVLPEARKP